VKSGVEDGDVGAREDSLSLADAQKVGRIVQRGELAGVLDGILYFLVNQHRLREVVGAVHNAMSDHMNVMDVTDEAALGGSQVPDHFAEC